jgi:glycosyltransferase involved in cell wall biosynthesis
VIAGAVQHQSRDYYETVVKPHVDGEQISLWRSQPDEKWNLFSKAKAFLFPIQWPEPFGLVMIEAMAAGTPVIAFPEGSVPEVVEDGRSGFLVHDAEEMVAAISRIDSIDPAECRRYVQENFSVSKCTDGYENVYRKILEG